MVGVDHAFFPLHFPILNGLGSAAVYPIRIAGAEIYAPHPYAEDGRERER